MGKSRKQSSLPRILSSLNCVLLSALIHFVFLIFPYQRNTVEAMPGSISMAIVSGAGKTEMSSNSANLSTSSAKSDTQQRAKREKKRTAPKTEKKSIVHPKPKSAPEVPPPIVPSQTPPKKQSISVAKAKPKPTAPPQQVVKKKKVHSDKPNKKSHDRKIVAPKKQPKQVKVAETPPKQILEKPQPPAQNKGQDVADADQGKYTKQPRAADGSSPGGPVHARIGSLFGPKITHWTRPQYPRKARAMGETGVVVLRITIDSSGSPTRVEVVQKAGFGFDEAAVSAVNKASFTPATHKGQPVACIALLPVHFTLKGN